MMEQAFRLDNLLAACTALSALVVIYGGWIYLSGLNNPLEKKEHHSQMPTEAGGESPAVGERP